MICVYCKEDIKEGAIKCKHCGSVLNKQVNYNISDKSKIIAGVLALILGGFGIHKFYLGAWGWGIVYIVLVWTWIPMIVSLIEGIRYLIMSEEEFNQKIAVENKPFSFLW